MTTPSMPDDRPALGESQQTEEILSVAEVERLRALGYVVVPLRPSDEMLKVGAPKCFQVADGHDPHTWETALTDAAECYRAMTDLGCL